MVNVSRRGFRGSSVLPLVLAATIAAAALAGCYEQDRSGKPLHAPAGFDPTLPAWVACSRLIVEGDVVRVTDAGSPGQMVTELAVSRWIKPTSGPKMATIETPDIAAEGVYQRWEPGMHLLLQVDVDPSALPNWQFGDRMIKKIKQAIPASRTIECPYGPA
jgi:hypothetical protein